jgi:5'-phosphate synthase pdxT subunit
MVKSPNSPHNGTVGVLAVQGDFDAHRVMLDRLQTSSRLVRKAAELENLSGLILPGGESTTLLKFFERETLWEPLQRFAQEHPVFGTCAGAILMAEQVENPPQRSLGLIRMRIRRNAYGRQVHSSIHLVQPAPELGGSSSEQPSLEAVMIRAPVITDTAKDVTVLASFEQKPILVRQGRHLAATFHPELTSDTRVHSYFCGIISQRR